MRLLTLGAFAVAMLSVSSANAAYAQLTPPVGYSAGSNGGHFYKPAANEKWLQQTVRTNAALNVGGRAVQVPVGMRLAANAPRFLAAAITPAWPVGLLIAGVTAASIIADPSFQEWLPESVKFNPVQNTWEYLGGGTYVTGDWACSGESALSVIICGIKNTHHISDAQLSGCRIDSSSGNNVAGSCVYVPNGVRLLGGAERVSTQTQWQPITPSQAEELITPKMVPDALADKFPMPWPVSEPVLNPSPTGLPQPITIPTGDPVPVPNTNPQQWSQPVARVTPSPTPLNPWRVDVRDDEVVSDSPNPLQDPVANPDSPPTKDKDDVSFNDTPLPPVPDFYEQKFPEGMSGIWDKHKDAMSGSGLGSLAGKLMPTTWGAGTCPTFSLPLDVGWLDAGTQDLSVPCEVWQVCKVLFLIGALLLARALIFGG